MLRRSRLLEVTVVLLMLLMMVGCGRKNEYMDYKHISSVGWMRKDTIRFCVKPMKEAGDYRLRLGLRSDNSYPFMNTSVIVEQKLYPEGITFTDTVQFDLTRANGRSRGVGVNIYQHVIDVDTIYLDVKDSLVISIRHDIKKDTLRGISDVGVELMR